jgi:hypothetical protein
VFAVSGGELIRDRGEYGRMQLETCLWALSLMGYDAFSPSTTELSFGPEALTGLSEKTGVPFVSANVLAARTGAPLFPRVVTLERAGTRIHVTGYVAPGSPGDFERNDIRLANARESVHRALEGIPDGEPVVVLAHGPAATARHVVAGLPPASTFVVLCPVNDESVDPAGPGEGPRMALAPTQGKYLGVARFGPAAARSAENVEFAPVEDTLPADSRIDDLMASHLQRLGAARIVEKYANDPGLAVQDAPVGSNRFVGSRACSECHRAAAHGWEGSAHRDAWGTLVETGHHQDPGCVRCHTVGYGLPSVFTSPDATGGLAGVGCESCHGPGGDHIAAVLEDRKASPLEAGAASCAGCHVPEHSPDFRFETRWKRIAHGLDR